MNEKLLWASGILATIAVLWRGSVVLGLYLGVLPGLLLAIAPSAFLYTATFAVLRAVVPLPAGIMADAAAAVLTIALAVALAAPAARAGRRAFAAAATGDVSPDTPVRIAGHVRLERTGLALFYAPSGAQLPECDALCAALLDTPGVLSVTLAGYDRSGAPIAACTYRLVPKAEAPVAGLAPSHPEKILQYVPGPAPSTGSRDWRADNAAAAALRNAITAKWALRLASEQTLVAQPLQKQFDLIIAIRDTRPAGPHRIAVSEIELRDSSTRVLLRRQRVTAAPIAIPLHLVPEGAMMDSGFGFGRRRLYTGARYDEIKPVEILFAETTLARPVAEQEDVGRMRDRLSAAVAQPGQTGDLTLVTPWLATLDWGHLHDADIDLLGRLIANPAVSGLQRLYDGYAPSVSPRLRQPITARLLDPATDDALRNTLNNLVRNMPPGTFAEVLPEERALLQDRALRLTSSALVARLADRGADAVPLLVALLLEDSRVEPWARRQWMMADIRRALSRLGPDAAPALPTVERLFEAKRLTNLWREAWAWRVAMVRMGKPVETLSFPAHLKPETVAQDRENIRKQAAREVRPDD